MLLVPSNLCHWLWELGNCQSALQLYFIEKDTIHCQPTSTQQRPQQMSLPESAPSARAGNCYWSERHQMSLATASRVGYIIWCSNPQIFSCLFVFKRSSCKAAKRDTFSELTQNFKGPVFHSQINFLNYDFSQYSVIRCNFCLVKRSQLFYLQQQFLLHKSFSAFQHKFVRTAYGTCSTRPSPYVLPGVKNVCLFAEQGEHSSMGPTVLLPVGF